MTPGALSAIGRSRGSLLSNMRSGLRASRPEAVLAQLTLCASKCATSAAARFAAGASPNVLSVSVTPSLTPSSFSN